MSKSSARDSLALSLILGFATLVSFVSQLAIARTFGTGLSMDLYLQAIAIPLFVLATFGGLFNYAMVPVLTRARADAGHSRMVAGAFLRAFGILALVVGIAGWMLAPFQLRVLGAGRLSPESLVLSTLITRLTWVTVAISIVCYFMVSVGNAAKRFLIAGLSTILPLLGILIACVGWGTRDGVSVLSVGYLTGYAAAAFWLLGALRHEFAWSRAQNAPKEVRGFFLTIPLVLVAVFTFSTYPAIDAFWAPRLGASNLSYLGYCQRILVAAATVMIAGPSTVLQTRLSEAAHEERHEDLFRELAFALRLTIAIAAPISLIVGTLRYSVIRLMFERGAFDAVATEHVSALLPWMLPGMVALSCVVLLFKATFARGDVQTCVRLGAIGPLMYFLLSGWLSNVFGVTGIGAAFSLTWIAVASFANGSLRRAQGGEGELVSRSTRVFAGRLVLALAVCGAMTWSGERLLLGFAGTMNTLDLLWRIAAVSMAGTVAYLAMALYVGRIPELASMLAVFKQRPAAVVK